MITRQSFRLKATENTCLICVEIMYHSSIGSRVKSLGISFLYCSDSITMAEAPPPPLQIPAHPILPFFSFSTLRRVVVILAPEAPRA
jgi:hypothetical protein